MKQVSTRIEDTLHQQVVARAKELGMSLNSYINSVLGRAVGASPDFSLMSVVKGALADGMMLMGNVITKVTALSRKTRFVIAEGYLWLCKPTANWSGRELHKLSAMPKTLSNHSPKMLEKWLEMSFRGLSEASEILSRVEVLPWFQEMSVRQQEYVIEALINGDSYDDLIYHYAPKTEVVTEPEEVVITEEVPTKLKAAAMQQRYGLTEQWHTMVGTWKKEGLTTADGVWKYLSGRNQWVLS